MEKNQSDNFGILLGLAYQSFVDQLRVNMAEHGFDDLGRSYGYVFRALAGETLKLNQIAVHLGITSPGAMKIVDEMEERGYVERHDDLYDKRAKQIKLTKRGEAAVKCAKNFHAAFEARLRAQCNAGEVDTLRVVLNRIVASDMDASAGQFGPR